MLESKVLESKVQSETIKAWREDGWKCIKNETPTENAWPDFTCYGSGARVVFIEFKKEGEEPNAQQLIRHQELMDLGFDVYVIDNIEDGLKLLWVYQELDPMRPMVLRRELLKIRLRSHGRK